MSYYEQEHDGSRRCRRCKRKRLDDEPPEVMQYKTCAKCRIIERQKKKLKKPLTEETINYGMRQMQEQLPTGWAEEFFNETEDLDEGLIQKIRNGILRGSSGTKSTPTRSSTQYSSKANDGFSNSYSKGRDFKDDSRSNGLLNPQIGFIDTNNSRQTHNLNGGYGQTANVNHTGLINNNINMNMNMNLNGNGFVNMNSMASANNNNVNIHMNNNGHNNSNNNLHLNNNNNNQSNIHNFSSSSVNTNNNGTGVVDNEPLKPIFCDLCSGKIETDLARRSYNICKKCCTDPFRTGGVYDDFITFLHKISPENVEKQTTTFVKEVITYDLGDVVDANVNNERQFREMILNGLKSIYLNTVMATTGHKFTRVSSNLAITSHSAPIINAKNGNYIYEQTEQIKALYKAKQETLSDSGLPQIFVSYSIATNIVIIKVKSEFKKKLAVSPLTTSSKYPQELIELIQSILQEIKLDGSVEITGFNSSTGGIVYDILQDKSREYPSTIVELVSGITKEAFASDFAQLESLISPV